MQTDDYFLIKNYRTKYFPKVIITLSSNISVMVLKSYSSAIFVYISIYDSANI